jgi:hypothetical protein
MQNTGWQMLITGWQMIIIVWQIYITVIKMDDMAEWRWGIGWKGWFATDYTDEHR